MIYDRLDQIERYKGLQPRLYKALELLRDTDFSKIPDGTYEVEGRDLFYFVQSYDNKPDNDGPEAHKAYVDIQCVLEGREKMGVGILRQARKRHLVLPRPHGLCVPGSRQVLPGIPL